jgi:hypothetical protein
MFSYTRRIRSGRAIYRSRSRIRKQTRKNLSRAKCYWTARSIRLGPLRMPEPSLAVSTSAFILTITWVKWATALREATGGKAWPLRRRAIMEAAFASYTSLNRLRAMADTRNIGSLRVMEKLGMVREGVLRQNRLVRGEFIDEVWCGVLRNGKRGCQRNG